MKIKLKQAITAGTLADLTHASALHIPPDTKIEAIATHSSEVEENTLFLALKGEKTSGEKFLPQVLERGGYMMSEQVAEGCITVPSVTDALFMLAEAHLSGLRKLKHTVGITGSTGKTTTKEILRALTANHFCTHATEGNQNSEIGLPLTVLCADESTECLILEMGMNHAGEIRRLSQLCRPSLAIITGIGHAHIGNLGSREAIALAKREILCGMQEGGRVFIPADEPLLSDIAGAKAIGFKEAKRGLYLHTDAQGKSALMEDGKALLSFNPKMQDTGMLCAAAFASAAALALGIDKDTVQKEIYAFSDNVFRQKAYRLEKTEILYDAYNASYESVLCAIDALKKAPQRERALLLGDMLELGDFSEELHREIGAAIGEAKNEIDTLFLFGPACRFVLEGALQSGYARERIFYNPSEAHPTETADAIRPLLGRNMRLTIKGARGMKMERILHILINQTGGDNDAG